jgi:hypothetical protein
MQIISAIFENPVITVLSGKLACRGLVDGSRMSREAHVWIFEGVGGETLPLLDAKHLSQEKTWTIYRVFPPAIQENFLDNIRGIEKG